MKKQARQQFNMARTPAPKRIHTKKQATFFFLYWVWVTTFSNDICLKNDFSGYFAYYNSCLFGKFMP